MVRREAEIQQLWGSGAFRGQSLRALSGERYVVLHEGRRGAGAGPDFRDAVLVDDQGARRVGDVEIHLRAANWRAHGHDRDHRYDAVTLHVVLNAGADRDTTLAGGARAALTVLEAAWLDNPPGSSPTEGGGRWPCHVLSDDYDARIAARPPARIRRPAPRRTRYAIRRRRAPRRTVQCQRVTRALEHWRPRRLGCAGRGDGLRTRPRGAAPCRHVADPRRRRQRSR